MLRPPRPRFPERVRAVSTEAGLFPFPNLAIPWPEHRESRKSLGASLHEVWLPNNGRGRHAGRPQVRPEATTSNLPRSDPNVRTAFVIGSLADSTKADAGLALRHSGRATEHRPIVSISPNSLAWVADKNSSAFIARVASSRVRPVSLARNSARILLVLSSSPGLTMAQSAIYDSLRESLESSSANRFPFAPCAAMIVAIAPTSPWQQVRTGGETKSMVSTIARPALTEPPGDPMWSVMGAWRSLC